MYAQGGLEDMTGRVESWSFRVLTSVAGEAQARFPFWSRGGVRAEEAQMPADPSEIIPPKKPLQARPRDAHRILWKKATPATVDALHVLFREKKGAEPGAVDVERAVISWPCWRPKAITVLPDRYFMLRVEELCGRGR